MRPVIAPVGTTAVTWVSEFTVKLAAFSQSKPTLVVWVRLFPVIVTGVPAGPLVGLKLKIFGVTRNCVLLFRLAPGVVTVTGPVVAPLGTVVFR
jgi:hypothetical protein